MAEVNWRSRLNPWVVWRSGRPSEVRWCLVRRRRYRTKRRNSDWSLPAWPVVDPGDPVPGQHVHDRAGPGPVEQVDRQVIHEAVGRAREQEPAVRERRPEAGAEPVVGQREGPGQPVVERQVPVGPVGHGRGLVGRGRGLLGRGHEAVHLAVGPLRVAGGPALAGRALRLLHGGARVIGPDHGAVGGGVLGIRRAVRAAREPFPAAERAKVVVEGVVLHHQHDDVLDPRQQVGARPGGWGRAGRPAVAGSAVHSASTAPARATAGARSAPRRSRLPSSAHPPPHGNHGHPAGTGKATGWLPRRVPAKRLRGQTVQYVPIYTDSAVTTYR